MRIKLKHKSWNPEYIDNVLEIHPFGSFVKIKTHEKTILVSAFHYESIEQLKPGDDDEGET